MSESRVSNLFILLGILVSLLVAFTGKACTSIQISPCCNCTLPLSTDLLV
uniref:Hydrophobic seed protein domain-containing protein n=1 Tax=Triticum urartu TaxID=4572 RepID=A0A8R7JWL1_TRIUA